MKRLAWFTAVILGTLTTALLLWEFRAAVVLFVLAVTIAAAVRPLVDRLSAHGLPNGLALLITYAVSLGSIIGLVLILGGSFLTQLQQLANDLTSSYEHIKTEWPNGNLFQQVIAQQFSAPNALSQAIVGQQGSAWIQTVLGVTLRSFDLIGQMVIILVLSLYWNTDQEHFKRLWLSLLPSDMRVRAREIWQHIETGVGAYVRSEVIQSLLAVILLSTGYFLIGLNYPIVLGVIGAIGWLIPWVGVLLAVVPALLVGLSMNPITGLLAAGVTIAVLSLLEFVVEPRFFNRRRFSSLLVVIVVLVLADSYGVLGILLAPPLAAAIQIVAGQFIRALTTKTQRTCQISALQERLEAVQVMMATQPEPPGLEIINLIDRLTQLIERADQVVQLTDQADTTQNDFSLLPDSLSLVS